MYLNKMHVDPSGSATVYPEPSGKNDLYRFVDLSVWPPVVTVYAKKEGG